jgi:hypothetical protein
VDLFRWHSEHGRLSSERRYAPGDPIFFVTGT